MEMFSSSIATSNGSSRALAEMFGSGEFEEINDVAE